MKYVKASSDLLISFDFMSGQELAVPDAGSVKVYLSDASGLIAPYSPKVITTTSSQTSLDLTIEGAVNSKTHSTEFRYIQIKYKVDGADFQIDQAYSIVSRVVFPVSPGDIRALFGVSSAELPAADIDIVAAYADLQADIPAYDTEALFTSGSSMLPKLIEAIKVRAALNVLPSMPLRALQKHQADNVSGSRFSSIDWDKLEAGLRGRYNQLLNMVTPVQVEGAIIYAAQFYGTDPVTGS